MNLLPRVHAHVCDYPTIMRCNTRPVSATSGWLLLENQRRSADSLPFEVDCHLDPISDLDEWNAAVHAIVLRSKAIVL